MKNILTQFALDTKVDELQYDTGDTFSSSFQGILNAIIGVLALVAVVVMIVGGVSYMTSSGDAGKVKKAKDTILYGLIGLVVCVLAFAIVNFVISQIIGSN